MTSNTTTNAKCKQTCWLEQGYVILMERTLIYQKAVEKRIADLTKILTTEKERSIGKKDIRARHLSLNASVKKRR